jgi:hypothetical protein
MYAGPVNPRTGEQVYPGVPMTSELDQGQSIGVVPNPQYTTFFANTVFEDVNYDFKTFNFDTDVAYTLNKVVGGETLEYIHNATSPDLSDFKGRGGKMIVWHGWSDPLPQVTDTIRYYENVKNFFDPSGRTHKTEDFFRLFFSPNVGHCFGGNPGGENTLDLVTALEQWVEHGIAPDKIIASRVTGGVVARTRPVCAYPQVARYVGSGSIDDAANFVCAPNVVTPPSLIGSVGTLAHAGTELNVEGRLRNKGGSQAHHVTITSILPTAPLAYVGPDLPNDIGSLGPGATVSETLKFNVGNTPSGTVVRFNIRGTYHDTGGKSYGFSANMLVKVP